jgi:hypothetical protein
LLEVFRHELAHLALRDAVGGHAIPRWFNEGFAVFASGEGSFPRMQTLWTATVADRLLPLDQLARGFPADSATASVAYAQAADVVRYLMRKQDEHRFVSFIGRLRRGQTFDSAMADAYGMDRATLEYEWRQDVAKRYTFWPFLFSGTVVWVGIVGLFVWGWRRRKRRSEKTLARWDAEERMEDQRRQLQTAGGPRVHIVLARGNELPSFDVRGPGEVEIPKVEHEGQWHTLH